MAGYLVGSVVHATFAKLEDTMSKAIDNVVKMAAGAALSRRWIWRSASSTGFATT